MTRFGLWLFLACAFNLMGCGHAWVVSQSRDGGRIGYTQYSDTERGVREVYGLIHCRPYRIVDDEYHSQRGYSTMTVPDTQQVSAYSPGVGMVYGTIYGSKQVVVSKTDQWRELVYVCPYNPRGPAPASATPLSRGPEPKPGEPGGVEK